MTGLPDSPVVRDINTREFHREQLSAMMDGELSADETRFLLRRMEHDDELADCWERWQFFGDAMRGRVGGALPADFSRRIGRAIADGLADDLVEASQVAAGHADARRPLLRWGGGAALAASVALIALIGTRTLSAPDERVTAASATASIQVPSPRPSPKPIAPVPGVVPGPITPPAPEPSIAGAGAAAALMAAAASSERRGGHPRILAAAEAIPSSDAVSRAAAANRAAQTARSRPASAEAFASTATQGRGVAGGNLLNKAEITPKPWPRALVPGASAVGEVTAGFEDPSALHPFQPRLDPLLSPQSARPVEDAASSP